MAACKHKRQKFLGIQDFGPDLPKLRLYNCLDCKTTLARPTRRKTIVHYPDAQFFFTILSWFAMALAVGWLIETFRK